MLGAQRISPGDCKSECPGVPKTIKRNCLGHEGLSYTFQHVQTAAADTRSSKWQQLHVTAAAAESVGCRCHANSGKRQ
jgi:hypothetical protein